MTTAERKQQKRTKLKRPRTLGTSAAAAGAAAAAVAATRATKTAPGPGKRAHCRGTQAPTARASRDDKDGGRLANRTGMMAMTRNAFRASMGKVGRQTFERLEVRDMRDCCWSIFLGFSAQVVPHAPCDVLLLHAYPGSKDAD